MNPEIIIPSANQGIIAVATRAGDEDIVSFMNNERTWLESSVERTVIRELGVGCAVPVGVYARFENKVKLFCEIFGKKYIRVEETLSKDDAVDEAREIAKDLRREIYAR